MNSVHVRGDVCAGLVVCAPEGTEGRGRALTEMVGAGIRSWGLGGMEGTVLWIV